jgi:hypothetical protein
VAPWCSQVARGPTRNDFAENGMSVAAPTVGQSRDLAGQNCAPGAVCPVHERNVQSALTRTPRLLLQIVDRDMHRSIELLHLCEIVLKDAKLSGLDVNLVLLPFLFI